MKGEATRFSAASLPETLISPRRGHVSVPTDAQLDAGARCRHPQRPVFAVTHLRVISQPVTRAEFLSQRFENRGEVLRIGIEIPPAGGRHDA